MMKDFLKGICPGKKNLLCFNDPCMNVWDSEKWPQSTFWEGVLLPPRSSEYHS